MPTHLDSQLVIETHDNVPQATVAEFVRLCLARGAVFVVVTQNQDGRTCTVTVRGN